jgi:hypothetical protein
MFDQDGKINFASRDLVFIEKESQKIDKKPLAIEIPSINVSYKYIKHFSTWQRSVWLTLDMIV